MFQFTQETLFLSWGKAIYGPGTAEGIFSFDHVTQEDPHTGREIHARVGKDFLRSFFNFPIDAYLYSVHRYRVAYL